VGKVLGWREFGMEGHCPEKRALERKWGKRRKSGDGLQSGLNVGRRAFIQGVHVGSPSWNLLQQCRERYIKWYSRKLNRKIFQQ